MPPQNRGEERGQCPLKKHIPLPISDSLPASPSAKASPVRRRLFCPRTQTKPTINQLRKQKTGVLFVPRPPTPSLEREGFGLSGRIGLYCIATGTWYNAGVSKSPCEYKNGAVTFCFAELERARDQKELPYSER